jgi:hypothetical protein
MPAGIYLQPRRPTDGGCPQDSLHGRFPKKVTGTVGIAFFTLHHRQRINVA